MTHTSIRTLTLALLLAFVQLPAAAADLRVAVASNFARTAAELATLFTARSGHEVLLSTGSTGKLYAQISNGAPFDLLLAADTLRPQLLEESGVAIANSRMTYARGTLVLWSRETGTTASDMRQAVARARRIAIANPALAPYGAAAKQVLQVLQLWERATPKLVRGESIGQTYQFVATGNADIGFVAGSQLPTAAGTRWNIPQQLHAPLDQQLVLLNDSIAGREFIEFMRSQEALDVMLAAGYLLPGD